MYGDVSGGQAGPHKLVLLLAKLFFRPFQLALASDLYLVSTNTRPLSALSL